MPEIRELRYFIALAQELHFGRAADRLHLSQSALSHAIRRLEGKLGFELFRRGEGRVELTPEGSLVLEDAKRVVSSAARLERRARNVARGELGRIAVAYVPSIQETAAAALSRFAADSGIGIDSERAVHKRVVTLVAGGAVDVGIAHALSLPDSLEGVPFTSRPLILAVGDTHPLAGRESVSLADVADFLLPYVNEGGAEQWRALFAHNGLGVRTVQIEDPVAGVPVELVRGDPTIAWLQTDEYGPIPGLQRVELKPKVSIAFQLVFRTDSHNPDVATLVEALGEPGR